MNIIDTKIPGVKIIEPKKFSDKRGFFMETWNQKKFEDLVTGKKTNFVQDNQSFSNKGVLRGLHFQSVNTQGKLVRVTKGKVFDVAVDIRHESKTFGEWVGVDISEENKRMLWIPEGFAHGFYVMSETAEFLYKCTDYYNPVGNITLDWNDKDLNINWPLEGDVILSELDEAGISLKECKELGFLVSEN